MIPLGFSSILCYFTYLLNGLYLYPPLWLRKPHFPYQINGLLLLLCAFLPHSSIYSFLLPDKEPTLSHFPDKITCTLLFFSPLLPTINPILAMVPLCFPDICSLHRLNTLIWRCGARSPLQGRACDIKKNTALNTLWQTWTCQRWPHSDPVLESLF